MTSNVQQPYRLPGPNSSHIWPYLGVLAAGLAVYLCTAQSSVAWQDSGFFQWRMRELDLNSLLGIALAHPLLIVLGHVFGLLPWGSEFWRYNAVSAVAGAVTLANLFLLVRRLCPRRPWAAVLAAGALGLAHTYWWLASIAESHTLLAAGLTTELLILEAMSRRPRPWLAVLLGLVNGLGVSAHDLALLALPAYGLTVIVLAWRRKLPAWAVAGFVVAWLAGAGLWVGLIISNAPAMGLGGAMASALFGRGWQGSVFSHGTIKLVAFSFLYMGYNFPNLTWPLALAGLWGLKRLAPPGMLRQVQYLAAAYFLFAVRYNVADNFMFFVPLYTMGALLAGLGLASLAEKRPALTRLALAALVIGPVLYGLAPALARAFDLPLPGRSHQLPYRDNARYWLTPWKQDENSASQFAHAALDQVRDCPGQVYIFADSTAYWPLAWTARLEGVSAPVVIDQESDHPLMRRLEQDPLPLLEELRAAGACVYAVGRSPGYAPQALLPYIAPQRTGVLYPVYLPAGQATSAASGEPP